MKAAEVDVERVGPEALQEAAEERIGLWFIAWPFEEEYRLEPPAVRRETLRVVRELLSEGWLEAGEMDATGRIVPRGLSVEETLARIAERWDALLGGARARAARGRCPSSFRR